MSFRILIVTTVSEFLWQFEQDNIRILQQMGAEIHYASNFEAPDFAIGENYFEKNGIITHPLPSALPLAAERKRQGAENAGGTDRNLRH